MSKFCPDYRVPPGVTLKEYCELHKLNHNDVAFALNLTFIEYMELLNGDLVITDELAFRLATLTRTPAWFWMNREMQYRGSS